MDPIIGGALLGLGGDILGSLFGGSAQRESNRQNLKNAREQREWEAKMSNTAVQRRADDIEKAGFNRLLAATGAGASTPSVSPATNEPTFKPEWTKGGGAAALMLGEQLQNLRANTALTSAKAGQEQEVLEQMRRPGVGAGKNRYQSAQDIEDLHKRLKYDTDGIRKDMTAAQLKQFTDATEAVVQNIKQQAEKGKIELEQIKSVIEGFGLGAQAKATLLKSLMQIIVPLFKKE